MKWNPTCHFPVIIDPPVVSVSVFTLRGQTHPAECISHSGGGTCFPVTFIFEIGSVLKCFFISFFLFCFFWCLESSWHSSLLNRTLKLCLFKALPVPDGRGLSHWMPITEDAEMTISSPAFSCEAPPLWFTGENESNISSSSESLFSSDSWKRKCEMLNRTLFCLDGIQCFCVSERTKLIFSHHFLKN